MKVKHNLLHIFLQTIRAKHNHHSTFHWNPHEKMAWLPRVVRGAVHSGKKWRSALWLNAMHSGKK